MNNVLRSLKGVFTRRLTNRDIKVRWLLVVYDLLVYADVIGLLCLVFPSVSNSISPLHLFYHFLAGAVFIFAFRFFFRVYNQIWRYGSLAAFSLLMLADFFGAFLWAVGEAILRDRGIRFPHIVIIVCLNLIASIAIRIFYYYFYAYVSSCNTRLRRLFNVLTLSQVKLNNVPKEENRIRIAVLGAGRVGISLVNELVNNPQAPYLPVCYIDNDRSKAGRSISDIPILGEDNLTRIDLTERGVQEIVFAVPNMEIERQKELYTRFKELGFPVKVYAFPVMESMGRRSIRDFDVEELLFRQQIQVDTEEDAKFYRDKVILITGGGGSIGSEICRQLAKMEPKRLVILDIAENGAYDVQQELKLAYGRDFPICIEIASVRDRKALERIFEEHKPQIVVMAAAHKHVPLMEKNCIEAVENNVFGTLNTVEVSEEYGVERVIMVSTDKAVNPTNVMGATKRVCEMIVQAHSVTATKTTFSATRFGNVLGSAGSVIPLFKRQIAKGGPVTITDKRIIRYFMTIPEASQLVLESGAMAKNGELFVLNMGRPVKIYDLAENMIRLSGLEPGRDIEIREVGLRPGEKLYEELLIQGENLTKTKNDLIFVEKDIPLSMDELNDKLRTLRKAIDTGTDEDIKDVLHQVVPTYHPDKAQIA